MLKTFAAGTLLEDATSVPTGSDFLISFQVLINPSQQRPAHLHASFYNKRAEVAQKLQKGTAIVLEGVTHARLQRRQNGERFAIQEMRVASYEIL